MVTWVLLVGLGIGSALLLAFLCVLGLFSWQARRLPKGRPDYVALGSSFAAGIGLGERAPGSPLVCMRSINGYPQILARMRGLSLVDMSCSGATSRHVLKGGQVFLGPQVNGVGRETRLVTMTVGGNDIGYVGDMSILAARRQATFTGRLARFLTRAPHTERSRDYDAVSANLMAIIRTVRRRAPEALIVVLGYPQILPPEGTSDALALTASEVATMRSVGDRLLAVTREAALDAGAHFIDMQALGAAHHAGSPEPWVNGWRGAVKTPFHPTLAGATAIAHSIATLLDRQG